MEAGHCGRLCLREQSATSALLEPVHRARCEVDRRPLRSRLGKERVPGLRSGASRGALRVSALVRATVEKACRDRALCALVVPVAILAPYWSKLLYASALPLGTRSVRSRRVSSRIGRWRGTCGTRGTTCRRSWRFSRVISAASSPGPGCRLYPPAQRQWRCALALRAGARPTCDDSYMCKPSELFTGLPRGPPVKCIYKFITNTSIF
jgi:hypothetical protein